MCVVDHISRFPILDRTLPSDIILKLKTMVLSFDYYYYCHYILLGMGEGYKSLIISASFTADPIVTATNYIFFGKFHYP